MHVYQSAEVVKKQKQKQRITCINSIMTGMIYLLCFIARHFFTSALTWFDLLGGIFGQALAYHLRMKKQTFNLQLLEIKTSKMLLNIIFTLLIKRLVAFSFPQTPCTCVEPAG